MLERAPPQEGPAGTRPVAFRGGGFAPRASRYAGWIALAAVLAIWQALGSAGLVNALFLPTPSAIVRAIWQLAVSGALWQHVSASLLRIGTGWVLGTIAGVAVGFAIGLFNQARAIGITFASIDVVRVDGAWKVLEINSGVMMEALGKLHPDLVQATYDAALDRVFGKGAAGDDLSPSS